MYQYALTFLFERDLKHNDLMSAFSVIRKTIQKTVCLDDFELELTACFGSGSACVNPDGIKKMKAHFHGILTLPVKLSKEIKHDILKAIRNAISYISLNGIKAIYNLDGWQDYIESHPFIGKAFKWSKAQKDTNLNEQNAKIIQDLEVNEVDNVLTDISATNKTNIDKNINISNFAKIQAPTTLIGAIKTFIQRLCHRFSWLRVWV